MKKILLFTACLACAYVGFAQDAGAIPGLQRDLQLARTDGAKVDALAALCFAYADVNTDTGLLYGNQAIALAQKIHYAKGLGDGWNNIGWSYYRSSRFTQAEECFTKALAIFNKEPDKRLAIIPLSNLGTLYTDKAEYAKAITSLKEAHNYQVQLHDAATKNAGLTLYSIGRVYNRLQEFNEARNYFTQDSAIQSNLHDSLHTSQAVMSIGNTYLSQDNYPKALLYYKQALAYINTSNDYYSKGIALENMALCYTALKDYRQATRLYKNALQDYTILKSKSDLFEASTGLAGVYEAIKDTASERAILDSALRYAIELDDKTLLQAAFKNLSSLYEAEGNYKRAYNLLDSAYYIKDSALTTDKQNEILKLKTQFETEKKEQENQLLKAENTVSYERLQQNRLLLWAAVAVVLLLAGLLYMLYRNRQVKVAHISTLEQLNHELALQKEQVSNMNVQLEVRSLTSQMQPHFIFNCMSSIQECLLTGQAAEANEYLSTLARLLRLVFSLSVQEKITLAAEIDMLTLYLELEKKRLKESFDFSINIEEDIITEDVLVPAFTLQPYAENAVWHGLAGKQGDRRISITIGASDHLLHCTVLDNGVGRKKAAQTQKLHKQPGVSSMVLLEKRLRIFQKQYNIEDIGVQVTDEHDGGGHAGGTKVEVILPLIFA